MVAVVRSPAERQLRQVAGADDKTASLVGQVHQDLRTLAGLAVLVGHVLHGRIVLNVSKVLLHGRVNRNLAEAHAQVAGERLGIRLGAMRRAKAGHGNRRDTRAWQSQCIEGTHGHKQCQRGVQATRKTDDCSLGTRMGKAGLEARSLQIENSLATLGQITVVGRHKRRARENTVDIAGIAQDRLFGQHALKENSTVVASGASSARVHVVERRRSATRRSRSTSATAMSQVSSLVAASLEPFS